MSPRDAFKAGFLAACAERGLAEADAGRLAKSANWAGTLGNLSAVLGGLALVTPPALGYAAGSLAGRLRDAPYTGEDVRKQELIEEYRRLAARARRAALRKGLPAPAGGLVQAP